MELPDNLKPKADESRVLNAVKSEERTLVAYIKARAGWIVFWFSLIVLGVATFLVLRK